jgi:hypothetical protein
MVSNYSIRYDGAEFGKCWQNAFGMVPEINLYDEFQEFGGAIISDGANRVNLTEGDYASAFGIDIVCEVSELFRTTNAVECVDVEGFAIIQGESGLMVELGTSPRIRFSLWHVCSLEETALLYGEPSKFFEMISNAQRRIGVHKTQQTLRRDDPGMVYVGALLMPFACPQVPVLDTNFFPPNFVHSKLEPWDGRTRFQKVCSSLRSLRLPVNLSANLTTSFAGNSAELNAEWDKPTDSIPPTITERPLQQIFYEVRQQSVLVYEAESGLVSEQNLYAIVGALVDACELRRGVKQEGNTVDLDYDKPVLKICDKLRSAYTPIVCGGEIGGIVLQDIVRDVGWFRLSEKPPKLPEWTNLRDFSEMIGVAIYKLERQAEAPDKDRRNLIMSLPLLERKLGCLRRIQKVVNTHDSARIELAFSPKRESLPCNSSRITGSWFKAFRNTAIEECTSIVVHDIIESLFNLPEVIEDCQLAAKLEWNRVYGGRKLNGLPGLAPSAIVKRVVEELGERSLSDYVQCSNLQPGFVGIMLEIGSDERGQED